MAGNNPPPSTSAPRDCGPKTRNPKLFALRNGAELSRWRTCRDTCPPPGLPSGKGHKCPLPRHTGLQGWPCIQLWGGGEGDRRKGCADKLVTEPRSQQIPGEPTKRDTQKLEETFVHVCVSIPEALGTPSQLPAPGSPSPGRRAGRLRCPGLEPPHWILPPQLRL